MDAMKAKRFPVSVIFIGIIVFALLMIGISHSIHQNISWSGFAIDGQGLLYIAGMGKIDVIQQGTKVRELNAPTSRGFQFTIENGNTIVVLTGTACYRFDLNGNLIEKSDAQPDLRNRFTKESRQYTANDGLTYHLSSPWWRPQIALLQNGQETVVYQMPIADYLVRIMLVCAGTGLLYCVIMLLRWKYGKTA